MPPLFPGQRSRCPDPPPPPDHSNHHELADGGTFGYASTLGEPHVLFKTQLEAPPKISHDPHDQGSSKTEQIRCDQSAMTYLPNTHRRRVPPPNNLTTRGVKMGKTTNLIDDILERKIPTLPTPNRPPPHPPPRRTQP